MSKKVIITEKQFDYILEVGRKTHLLSEAIKEELSINNEILSLTNKLGAELISKLNTTEKFSLGNGITRELFKLEPITLNGFEITVSVLNIDFRDRKCFSDNYNNFETYINSSITSPLMEKKMFFIYLHTCSISGGLKKDISLDNLQHELEHCYQSSITNTLLPKDDNYSIALKTINGNMDEKELEYIISEALYYSYSFEQDGYVNGLYQYLVNSEEPVFDLFDIVDNSACKAYFKLKDYISIIESSDENEVSEILRRKYKISYRKYVSILHKAEKRFIKKIGNVLALHRMQAIKNGVMLSECIGGDIVFI